MRKILITIDSYLPHLGGAEIYALKLGTILQERGYSVRLLTTDENPDPSGKETSPFEVIRVPYSRSPRAVIRFLRILYHEYRNAELIHCVYSYKISTIMALFKVVIRRPLVITLEGLGTLDMPGSSWFYSKVHSFYRYFSIRMADTNIAACLEFVDIALRYTRKENIVYIPNAIDINQFKPREKRFELLPRSALGKKIVITIRRFVPKNGIQFLVEAMPLIINRLDNVFFILIGWGRLEDYLKERVRTLGVGSYVYFAGKIENDRLPDFLNLSDIVVFPSTAEATSIACLESMALGKPIVASRVGGYPEMVSDQYNGYLIKLTDNQNSNYDAPMTLDADKLETLASSIISLLSDEEKLARFGKNSRVLAETKFSWKERIKDVEKIYEKIC